MAAYSRYHRAAEAEMRAKALRRAGEQHNPALYSVEREIYALSNPEYISWYDFQAPGELDEMKRRACVCRARMALRLARLEKSEIWRRYARVELRNARHFARLAQAIRGSR